MGAQLIHSTIHLDARRSALDIQRTPADDVVMGCLPLFHVFGLVVGLHAAILHHPRSDGRREVHQPSS